MADSAKSVQANLRIADQLHALSQLTEALVVKLVELEERLQRAEPLANRARAAVPHGNRPGSSPEAVGTNPSLASSSPQPTGQGGINTEDVN